MIKLYTLIPEHKHLLQILQMPFSGEFLPSVKLLRKVLGKDSPLVMYLVS